MSRAPAVTKSREGDAGTQWNSSNSDSDMDEYTDSKFKGVRIGEGGSRSLGGGGEHETNEWVDSARFGWRARSSQMPLPSANSAVSVASNTVPLPSSIHHNNSNNQSHNRTQDSMQALKVCVT